MSLGLCARKELRVLGILMGLENCYMIGEDSIVQTFRRNWGNLQQLPWEV